MHGHREFDGQLLANVDDKLYLMEEVAEHELVSKEFDAPEEHLRKKRKSIFLNESSMEKSQLCGLCCKTKLDNRNQVKI